MFTWFYNSDQSWNNALSFSERWKNPRLWIPELITWKIEDARIWDKVVFEDFSFEDWTLKPCKWLEKYLRIPYEDKEIILVDNHNVVLYFWYEARKKGLIKDWINLIHIDEHSDLWKCKNNLSKEDSQNLEKVFEFTNFKCNVWNYILPAEVEWLIWKTYQIRSETALNEHLKNPISWDLILNIDLDFWNPNIDFISYELKNKVTKYYIKKAKIITVATSPFFIEQELALKVFKELFS